MNYVISQSPEVGKHENLGF